MTEHCFLADFQPLKATTSAGFCTHLMVSGLNLATLFGVFWIIGKALKLGMS